METFLTDVIRKIAAQKEVCGALILGLPDGSGVTTFLLEQARDLDQAQALLGAEGWGAPGKERYKAAQTCVVGAIGRAQTILDGTDDGADRAMAMRQHVQSLADINNMLLMQALVE